MFKTKRQLDQFFFENTYNTNNENGSITFDKKIIVFEDIDCIGDIVLERKFKKNNKRNNYLQISKENIMQNICQMNDNNNNNNNNNMVQLPYIDNEPPITLDDILNLWDGIIETPGRILIISSNHYDKLDSALIRPGRIDISLELRNASHNVISELYFNFFETKIREKDLKKIKEYFYSPAEIVNIYLDNKNEDDFIKRIIKNIKP
jgi:SpoVK/Ycf46/Vps4 family AAA+-type ATPase